MRGGAKMSPLHPTLCLVLQTRVAPGAPPSVRMPACARGPPLCVQEGTPGGALAGPSLRRLKPPRPTSVPGGVRPAGHMPRAGVLAREEVMTCLAYPNRPQRLKARSSVKPWRSRASLPHSSVSSLCGPACRDGSRCPLRGNQPLVAIQRQPRRSARPSSASSNRCPITSVRTGSHSLASSPRASGSSPPWRSALPGRWRDEHDNSLKPIGHNKPIPTRSNT
jgi:hypothetical protein